MIPELITYEEAQNRYFCGYRTLRREIKDKKIKAYKTGKIVMIDRESGDSWFETKKIPVSARIGRPRKGAKRI